MTSSKSNKKSGCGCFPLLAVSLLTLGGGYFYGKNLLGSELTLKSSNNLIPASAMATSFVSTDTQKWSKLQEFGTISSQKIINENVENFVNNNLENNNNKIDIQQDILPWIGGVSLTILPPSESGVDYDVVAILGIKNKLKANNFFQKLKKDNQQKPIESKYQDTTIYQLINNNQNLWFTTFNNYLVISDQEGVIKKVIETYKGGESLANISSQDFTANDALIQVYLPNYGKEFLNLFNEVEINQQTQKELEKITSIAMNLSVENHGIKISSLVNYSQPFNFYKNRKPVSTKLLERIPDNAICMISGGGINQLWQELNEEKQNIPELNELINQAKIATMESLKLDLDTDVFSWLDGEFALALLPPNNNSLQGLLLLGSSNKIQGEKTFTTLENTFKFLPFLQVKQNNIEGINITQWNTLQQNLVTYGWLDNNNFLMTFLGDFQTIKNTNSSNALVNNDTFKLTTESLPKNNNGYVYCDIEKATTLTPTVNPNLSNSLTPEIKAFSDSVKAIALTNSSPNPNNNQSDLNISLNKIK